jgi:hypothetical protein
MSTAPNAADATPHFYKKGIHYYVAARFAILSNLNTISGTLFHHALERLLKGKLAETNTLNDLKSKYMHGLDDLWTGFKNLFPQENLTAFDQIVKELDRFEMLRYPDSVLNKGAVVTLTWAGTPLPPASQARGQYYQCSMDDMDRLVAKIIELCANEPLTYLLGLQAEARRIVDAHNSVAVTWFGS